MSDHKPSDELVNHALSSGSLPNEAALARAKRALERQRRMESGISGMVSSMVGRKVPVRVSMDMPTSTDNKTIFLKPDIRFGDDVPHDKMLCGIRDDTGAQRCPSCKSLDELMGGVYHEAAHIAFDSFATMGDLFKYELVERAIKVSGVKAGSRAEKLLTRMSTARFDGLSFVEGSKLVSPFFGPILNCLEDARVNAAMTENLPGLRNTFYAKIRDVFENGIEAPDGTVQRWSERPLEGQAVIAAFLIGSGYDDLLQYLSPELEDLLNDPAFVEASRSAQDAKSVEDVYGGCFQVLEAARRHGYMKRPDDIEDDQPEEEGQPEDQPGAGQGIEAQDDGGNTPGKGDNDGEASALNWQDKDSSDSDQPADDEQDDSDQPADSDQDSTEDSDSDQDGTEDDSDTEDSDSDQPADDDQDDTEDSDSDQDSDSDSDSDSDGASDTGQAGTDDPGELDDADKVDDDELAKMIRIVSGHSDPGESLSSPPERDSDDDQALEVVEVQLEHFDQPSTEVFTVNILKHDKPFRNPDGSNRAKMIGFKASRRSWDNDRVPEPVLAKSVQHARLIFAENRAVHDTRGLRTGRVDGGRLARVRTGEVKVFQRRQRVDERDYSAVVGLDISGSTASGAIVLIKQIGRAIGEVFNRTGVGFSMYAHTAEMHDPTRRSYESSNAYDVDLHEIKDANQPWGEKCHTALDMLGPASANLDGHTLEAYRKMAEASSASNRMIFYLTDGAMPCENYDEELEILQREIDICKRLGIMLVGIGVRTDAPIKHGLDTIRIDRTSQLPELVRQVEKRLVR